MGTSRANAASLLPVHARMIKDFAQDRGLNRELEALPSEKEIRRRTEVGIGLTSPELATLMAHVKLALKDDVLASDLPDQEAFAVPAAGVLPGQAARRVQHRHPLAPTAPGNRDHDAGQRSRRHQRHQLRLPGHRRRRCGTGGRGTQLRRRPTRSSGSARCGARSVRAGRVGGGVGSDDAGSAPARSTAPGAGCSTTGRNRLRSAPRSTGSPRRWPR